jgi:hypothetical protein
VTSSLVEDKAMMIDSTSIGRFGRPARAATGPRPSLKPNLVNHQACSNPREVNHADVSLRCA